MQSLRERLQESLDLIMSFVEWMLIGLLIGAACGVVGTAFHYCVNYATGVRKSLDILIWFLPVAGLLIVALYRGSRQSATLGTDVLFENVQAGKNVPFVIVPLIFVSTFITHLFGGSAGREGAALQIGGGIAHIIARGLRLDKEKQRIMTMVGMGALFSALFGTPVTSIMFVLELFCMGHFFYSCLLPTSVACVTAYTVAGMLGSEPEFYLIGTIPEITFQSALQSVALGIACAVLCVVFCNTMHITAKYAKKFFPNEYVRVAVGGIIIVALTMISGCRTYNGAGGDIIELAIEGHAAPQDFILKLIFTAITLGFCFKGGEIVPTFFVGATFGCVIAPLIGMDAGFGAAICLTALFCANTNCPLASICLGGELFGAKAMPLFVIACTVSYMLSSNHSLYHAQTTIDKKLKLTALIMPKTETKA